MLGDLEHGGVPLLRRVLRSIAAASMTSIACARVPRAADGVIHLGFKHDFSDMAGAGRTKRAAVQALCTTLVGSDRPFLFASGVAGLAPGRVATERDVVAWSGPDAPRGGPRHSPSSTPSAVSGR